MDCRRVRAIVVSFVCAALVGFPVSVGAQEGGTSNGEGSGEASTPQREEDEFKQRVSRAKQLYSNDQYEKAFEQFQQAYEIKESANLLFNMGLVNERMGNLEQALEYYEKFVVSPGIKLEMRKKAQERISVLETIVQKAEDEDKEASSEKVPEKGSPDTLAEAEQPTGDGDTDENERDNTSSPSDEASPPPSRGSSTRKKIAFTALGIGGVSLITGGVFAILGENARQNFEGRITPSGRRRASQAAFRNILIADIALGMGLVLGTTGAVLWATDSSAESNASRPRITPRVGPDRAALEFSIDF